MMYSRLLQCILSVSTKLRNGTDLYTNNHVSPNLILIKQQLLQSMSLDFSTESITGDKLHIAKDPNERKSQIDADAQKKIDALISENPELVQLQKVLKVEISVMKEEGQLVPSEILPRHWLQILQLKTRRQRQYYLEFLFKMEKKIENKKKIKEEKAIIFEKHKQERDDAGVRTDVMVYGIGKNSMFRRISDQTMNHLWKWNSLKAHMWGNKIIFDFSYEQYMGPKEIKSCAKQIMESYSINRQHNFAFDVYFCNVDLQGPLMTEVCKYIPTIFDDDFPWTVTSKSYMELFEKSNLVYLSGSSTEILEKYDPNSIYIIGAFVDKVHKKPVSLAKAKELGIRSVKLPIDRYLHFGDGSNKNLTLNQVIGIMLDSQCYSWEKALNHIPRRKLFENRLRKLENKVQKQLFWTKNEKQENSNHEENTQLKSSSPVYDFSHAARIKLRGNWKN